MLLLAAGSCCRVSVFESYLSLTVDEAELISNPATGAVTSGRLWNATYVTVTTATLTHALKVASTTLIFVRGCREKNEKPLLLLI